MAAIVPNKNKQHQHSEKWINQKMLQSSKTNFRRPDPVDPNLF